MLDIPAFPDRIELNQSCITIKNIPYYEKVNFFICFLLLKQIKICLMRVLQCIYLLITIVLIFLISCTIG